MELIYIGKKFYWQSGTAMSSLYDVNGNRQDWGFVQIALQNGESVRIRPATITELALYEKKLLECNKDKPYFETQVNP